jgi:hypothetical protein
MKLSRLEIKKLIANFYPVLKDNDIEQFLSITVYKLSKRKALLLKGGGTSKQVVLILKGAARAYRIDESGHDLNNYIREEGRIIADAKVFGNDVQILNVESISEIHYLKFDITELEAVGLTNQSLMKFYLTFLKEIILTLSHRVDTFVSLTSQKRYEDLVKRNPSYLFKTYDKHIASFLGVTPLTLYRIKKKAIK